MAEDLEVLGSLGGERVQIVDPDPHWPAIYAEWEQRIRTALGDTAVDVQHIGSTSVPGLPAKPVVDIDVTVPDLEDEAAFTPGLLGLGLILAIREPEQRFFRPDVAAGAARVVHVHVCAAGSDWFRDDLLFRDYLRAHPARRDAYRDLKRDFARRLGHDRSAYTDAKTGFVRETVRLAAQDRGRN